MVNAMQVTTGVTACSQSLEISLFFDFCGWARGDRHVAHVPSERKRQDAGKTQTLSSQGESGGSRDAGKKDT
ncbi:hypothetical protein ElyMa_005392900 [Elysia marginata]|uniref:Uncharacterized protein n=1 Tax=Elysia marginata TaxID=1093978 RepID=A0AAV4EFB5_9GAST|nr:hypothetical protein ElyMa_005392900 [Elysia marginata]